VCHEKYWKNVITWGDSDVCYRVKLKQWYLNLNPVYEFIIHYGMP
jgi:hypothetical protein